MKDFKSIKAGLISENIFKLIGSDWMLITAGDIKKYNTMTASWGTMGILWHKNIATCYVRPQRYTFQFMEENDFYTLSFFGLAHKEILNFCGSHSGKDTNKIKETGLDPIQTELGNIAFNQAKLVLECKKLYADSIKPENFFDKNIPTNIYAQNDFHKFYIGEIVGCYLKE